MTSELGYNTNLIRWMTIYIDMQANKTLFTLSVLSFLFLEKINILVNICFVFNKISFQFSFKKKKISFQFIFKTEYKTENTI